MVTKNQGSKEITNNERSDMDKSGYWSRTAEGKRESGTQTFSGNRLSSWWKMVSVPSFL